MAGLAGHNVIALGAAARNHAPIPTERRDKRCTVNRLDAAFYWRSAKIPKNKPI